RRDRRLEVRGSRVEAPLQGVAVGYHASTVAPETITRKTFTFSTPERAQSGRSRSPVRVHAGITGGTAIDTETRETGPVDLSGVAALRSVLRIRPFRRLWLVLGLASFGDWIGLLATGIFAAAQFQSSAGQGAAFGGTIAVRLLPALLLGPIAGVFADRFDRRYTMVITDLLRFVFYGSIPVVALVGASPAVIVAWATIATFIGETITLIWIPAK